MTFPTIAFTVDFNGDPLTPSGSPADLSSRVEAFSYTYGKQSALDEFQPGTLSVTLKNDDRVLDPLYAAGTYFGKLKPRKRVKLTATYGGTTYDQFTGFVDGWPQQYAPPAMAYVQLQATDLFVLLRNIDLPESVWMLEASSDPTYLWWRLNETSGPNVSDSSGNGHTGTLQLTRSDNLDSVLLPAVAVGPSLVAFDANSSVAIKADNSSTITDVPVILTSGLPSAGLPITIEAVVIHDLSDDALLDTLVWAELPNGLVLACQAYAASAGQGTFTLTAVWRDGSGWWTVSAPAPVDLNNAPHYLAFVFTSGGNHAAIYYDGTLLTGAASSSAGFAGAKQFIGVGHAAPSTNESDEWSGRVSDVRISTAALAAARITAHADAALTPWTGDATGARLQRIASYIGLAAADVSFATGATLLGPTGLGGDALTYMQSIALTEGVAALLVEHRSTTGAGGKLTFYDKYAPYTATRSTTSQATFTDDPAAGAGAYRFESDNLTLTDDESQIVNEAVVQWTEGEVRVSDATSITAHGRKSRTFQTRLATAAEAQSLAEFIVALYKDAHVRITSLTLNPAGDSNLWAPALSLRYGDRVTFRFQPQGVGTAINTDYWIQGVSVSASSGVNGWTTTFYVTPATDVQLAVWDTSIWDNAAALWGP